MRNVGRLIGVSSGLLLCAVAVFADVSSSESKRLSDAGKRYVESRCTLRHMFEEYERQYRELLPTTSERQTAGGPVR